MKIQINGLTFLEMETVLQGVSDGSILAEELLFLVLMQSRRPLALSHSTLKISHLNQLNATTDHYALSPDFHQYNKFLNTKIEHHATLTMLPPELIDRIFSFLRNDTSALKACSKAHPLYSRLAERHLYTNIVVDAGVSELHQLLSENPCFLDYPRAMEIRNCFDIVDNSLLGLSTMAMIPRMANLMSLKIYRPPHPFDHYEEFISTFKNCLQQSSIEQLYLYHFYDFPLSILDNGKSIRTLVLSDCTGQEEPISSSPSQQSFETLIFSGDQILDLSIWAMHRVSRLTALGLEDLPPDPDWTGFPELLTVCSNSLTTLHLDLDHEYSSKYSPDVGWIDDGPELPFTLSALICLKSLSIFGMMEPCDGRINCALPEIIRFINTAPAIQQIIISFHCLVSSYTTSPGQLDWSLLDRLQSNSTGTRPRIELCISAEGLVGPTFSPESILDDLAGSEALMDLVKRGLVILNPECIGILEWLNRVDSFLSNPR